MRSKTEVQEKFDELRMARLRKRKDEFLSRACANCAFNERVHIKGKGKVRICQNTEVLSSLRREVFVCDDDEVAQKCNKFQCRKTKEQVEQDFVEILKSPARCGDVYPKLALLIWFLQERKYRTRWERFCDCIRSGWNFLLHLVLFRWW